MPRSEIDDIFAAPKRPASSHPAPAPPASQEPEKKKKKSGKKRKREAEGKSTAPSDQPAEQPSKRKIPETILDPSLRLAGPPAKRSKPQAVEQPIAKKNSKVHREEEERFKDSRGTGPSMFLTTVNSLAFRCNIFRRRAQNRGGVLCLQGGRARYHRSRRRYA